jgi:hypothetical protein
MRNYRAEDRTMIQSYQDLSKYFPRLNIDKLKTIAQRWVDDNTNIPINSIVLYNYSPKRQKHSGEINTKYALVFEILREYKKYGMTLQELHDYHEATERGEIITPDPIEEFFDREENTPDPIEEFLDDTGYFETVGSENPFSAFMTKDFEDVYWETPKFKFKDEWELIPRLFIYDVEKNESVLMELPDNVRTREHEVLFQVQTDDSIFNYIKKYKLRFFPTPIERDEDIERDTWDKHIEPIVKDYNLNDSLGERFQYKFFTHPKTITEPEMHLMLRKTMDLCQEFSQDPKDEDRDNFLEKVMGKLKSDITEIRGKDGKKIDLKDMFHTFLVGLFKKKRMKNSQKYFYELPVFLALVNWEYAETDINKDTGKTNNIQKEAPEQRHKVFPCKPGTKWDEIEMALLPAEDKFMVKAPLEHGYYDHIDLKLHNQKAKSKKPISLWYFLKQLAKMNGFFPLKGIQDFEKISSDAKRLNKHLKQLFGINESIYKDRCTKTGGYKTKFKISQIPDDNVKVNRRSLIDEELEHPKYSNIKEGSYYPEYSTFKKE